MERPYAYAQAVTPSDSADLSSRNRALFVGGAGNVAVQTYDDEIVTFTGVPAGSILPVLVKRVRLTGTTATSILVLF